MKTQSWQMAMAIGLAISGAIVAFPTSTVAQVVADPSIGTVVTPNGTTLQITGGTTIGNRNLFHSFSQFDVPIDSAASFLNSPNIVNIFSRVTGGTQSRIDGIIRSAGTANLFLMNPSGIVFGQTARLDVGGSFIATTANAIQFGDRGAFNASLSAPPSQLLTVDPSAFLFNQVPIGTIVNRSIAATGFASPAGSPATGLRVPDGKSLVLVGGDINIEGGKVHALGGRVELGGLAEAGTIGVGITGNVFKLNFPANRLLSNLTLSKDARVSVRGGGGGNILVNTNVFTATDGGRLTNGTEGEENAGDIVVNANIFSAIGIGASGNRSGLYNLALGSGNAGNIIVNANSVLLDRSTIIRTTSLDKGRGGDVFIHSNELIVRNGGQITAGSGSPGESELVNSIAGSGGNITINVTNLIELDSSQPGVTDLESLLEQGRSGIFSPTSSFKNAGNITIRAGQLRILNGAIIETGASVAKSLGGNGGNIEVHVSGYIEAIGRFSGFTSEANGIGNAGDITIQANELSISNNAVIQSALTDGSRGAAGNILIKSGNVNLASGGAIISGVGTGSVGNGGQININANSLSIASEAQISSTMFGQGIAGNIGIHVQNGITIAGIRNEGITSGISSQLAGGGVGRAGNIDISAQSLTIRDGGQVAASVFRAEGTTPGGQGIGGDVRITTSDFIDISGTIVNGFSSGIFTNTQRGANGQGGAITLNTGSFRIADGAVVTAQTLNLSDGGNITINSNRFEATTGGQVLTGTFSSGKAGNIAIIANDSLTIAGSDLNFNDRFNRFGRDVVANVSPASGVFANTDINSSGNGGNISLTATKLGLSDGGQLSSQSQGLGSAGSITANARSIRLRGNSDILTISNGGNGGNITLNAQTIVALENSDILAFAPAGKGGNITFNTRAFLSDPLYRPSPPISDRAALNALLTNGRVDVNASGTVSGTVNGVPDISFLQNGLTQLPTSLTDTTQLLANSCIVRSAKQNGQFFITGSGGLPVRPGDAPLSSYPTGEVRGEEGQGERGKRGEQGESYRIQNPAPSAQTLPDRPWKIGDPIVEPQDMYRLPNGELVLSRECEQ